MFILFIFLISFQTFPLNLEKDVLEKAQNLILQKDRLKAVSLITSVIKNNNLTKQQELKAINALNVYGRMFLEEETQLTFEHGLSLINTDLDKAHQKIQEAKQKEPLNIEVGLSYTKILLLKKQCSEAVSNLEVYLKSYEWDKSLLNWQEKAILCVADETIMKEFISSIKQADIKEQKQRLLTADLKSYKGISLGWVKWILDKNSENLSRKQHQYLIDLYIKNCTQKPKLKDESVEVGLFCGKQEEFQSFFAKKFKIEEKNQK